MSSRPSLDALAAARRSARGEVVLEPDLAEALHVLRLSPDPCVLAFLPPDVVRGSARRLGAALAGQDLARIADAESRVLAAIARRSGAA